jgi:hypothetical protein
MSTALDVATGVVFLYLLLALMVTTVQELVASVLSLRAKNLYAAIEGMLESGNEKPGADGAAALPLVEKLFQHPLVKNLVNKELKVVGGKLPLFGAGLPSYIPSKTFALALLDVLQGNDASKVTGADKVLANAKGFVGKLPEGALKRSLGLLVDDAEEVEKDLDKRAQLVSDRIEGWFNDRMARASGWYKRNAQFWSLVIAAGVTVASNASTIHVAERLWQDASLRASVVASAQAFHDKPAGEPASSQLSQLPVGWQGFDPTCRDLVLLPAGWLITALAVSLGAAFWFDVLGKALQLRGSGPKISAATGEVELKNQ